MAGVTARVGVIFGHLQRQGARPSPVLCTVAASKRSSSSAAGDAWWAKHSRVPVLDSEMSYFDSDPGADKTTVIFLHGNPTSSFLWRNIIPLVQPHARCIAPDLIGMGRSGKNPSGSYRFVDQYRYLSAFLDKVKAPSQLSLVLHDWGSGLGFHWSHQNPARVQGIAYMEALVAPVKKWEHFPEISRKVFQINLPSKVYVVIHDWGSALGFHWCHQHPDRVQGIVFMEGMVKPVPGWDYFPKTGKRAFQALRSPAGEKMVLQKNFFVERLLLTELCGKLTEDEVNAYLAPYLEPGESRRPTLTFPREIPVIGDGPEDVIQIVSAYGKWLEETRIPKLYIHAEPGWFSGALKGVAEALPNVRTVTVKGMHFLQEVSPQEIGRAIADFIA